MVQIRAITESFDLYPGVIGQLGYGLGTYWLGPASASMIEGRFGGQACRLGGNGFQDRYRTFAEGNEGVVGFAFRYLSANNIPIIRLYGLDGSIQFQLNYDSAQRLQVRRGDVPTSPLMSQTSGPTLLVNVWHYIELAWKIDDVVGQVRVKLDGELLPELNYDGDTRSSTTSTGVGRMALVSQTGVTHDYDDLYIETGGMTFVGEGRLEALPVIQDVSNTGFTPSFGSRLYAVMSNVPAEHINYAGASAMGSIMRLKHKALSTVPEKIYGVQLINLSQKDEAGTRTIRNRLWSGASAYVGSDQSLQLNSPVFKEDWLGTDPLTTALWTAAGVNASEIGAEITT